MNPDFSPIQSLYLQSFYLKEDLQLLDHLICGYCEDIRANRVSNPEEDPYVGRHYTRVQNLRKCVQDFFPDSPAVSHRIPEDPKTQVPSLAQPQVNYNRIPLGNTNQGNQQNLLPAPNTSPYYLPFS